MTVTLQVKYLIHTRNNIFIYVFQNLNLPIIPAEFQEQCFQKGFTEAIKEYLCIGFSNQIEDGNFKTILQKKIQ